MQNGRPLTITVLDVRSEIKQPGNIDNESTKSVIKRMQIMLTTLQALPTRLPTTLTSMFEGSRPASGSTRIWLWALWAL